MGMLLLAAASLAADRTWTFGTDADWKEVEWAGLCFESEDGFVIKEVEVWARATEPDTMVYFGLWYFNGSSGSWYVADESGLEGASLTSETGEWVSSGTVSWDVNQVSNHTCVGLYTPGEGFEVGWDNDADDPVPMWAEAVETGYTSNANDNGTLYWGISDLTGTRLHMKITIAFADRDDDGYDELDDCDDGDEDINPGAEEVWYDGIDQDCDGNDSDRDEDGYPGGDRGTDCDDTDPDANPRAEETWYDGIDQDCDGNDADRDGDGDDASSAGGTDCDDTDPERAGTFDETWYDGVDQDCDGNDDDKDGDGHAGLAGGGEDCDDDDPTANPGGIDVTADGIDQDCDGGDGLFGDDPKDGGGGCCGGLCAGQAALLIYGALRSRRRRR